jgi:hypothetical protein
MSEFKVGLYQPQSEYTMADETPSTAEAGRTSPGQRSTVSPAELCASTGRDRKPASAGRVSRAWWLNVPGGPK